jgi:hypothetical protein
MCPCPHKINHRCATLKSRAPALTQRTGGRAILSLRKGHHCIRLAEREREKSQLPPALRPTPHPAVIPASTSTPDFHLSATHVAVGTTSTMINVLCRYHDSRTAARPRETFLPNAENDSSKCGQCSSAQCCPMHKRHKIDAAVKLSPSDKVNCCWKRLTLTTQADKGPDFERPVEFHVPWSTISYSYSTSRWPTVLPRQFRHK